MFRIGGVFEKSLEAGITHSIGTTWGQAPLIFLNEVGKGDRCRSPFFRHFVYYNVIMLRSLTFLLILSLSLYWYASVGAYCQAPLTYALVDLDERFNLTEAEALAAIAEAEALWETAAGRELFTRVDASERPDVTITFTFDDRQERAIAEETLRDSLDTKAASSEDLTSAYDTLVADYQAKRDAHQAAVGAYEARLQAHNELVDSYNATGGAPEGAFRELERAEQALTAEAATLEAEGEELNQLAAEINALGEQGNQIIRQYNAGVNAYNREFGEPDEFTQGDYMDGAIHIYTFTSRGELVNVLAHEFGHALDVDHVEGTASVMYYLMEDQPTPPELSPEDIAAFTAMCGETGTFGTSVRALVNQYIL